MFNMGISLLHARKPEEAFDCLIEAVQTYHMNPRLWLRLAECCIMTHKSVSQCSFVAKKQENIKDYDFFLEQRPRL